MSEENVYDLPPISERFKGLYDPWQPRDWFVFYFYINSGLFFSI